MHSRRRPLQDRIYTIYSVLTARKGVSAMQLSKELDCHYRTAWYMLHRVGEACGCGHFTLSEVVEIDETSIGGKRSAMSNRKRQELAGTGRGTVGKIPVIGLRERGDRLKAVALSAVTEVNKTKMTKLVAEHVEAGTTVYTDEHSGYGGLAAAQYQHEVVNHSIREYTSTASATSMAWRASGYFSIVRFTALGIMSRQSTLPDTLTKHPSGLTKATAIDTLDRMEALVHKIAGGQSVLQLRRID